MNKNLRGAALSLALTATLLAPSFACAAPGDGTQNPLGLPDISVAPSGEQVVPVDQATPEQLQKSGIVRPGPTEAELAEQRRKEAEEQARLEAEAAAKAAALRDAAETDTKFTGKTAAELGTGETARDRWANVRPDENRINAWLDGLEGKTIVDVEFVGAQANTEAAARAALDTRVGDTFRRDRLERDRNAIYDTGWFYDLFPTFKTVPEGVVIRYHVLENPTLNKLEITGNDTYKAEDIAPLITIKEGEMLNTRELRNDITAIGNKYHEDGYILVKVNSLDIDKDGKLKIVISEGKLEGYAVKGNKKTKDKVVLREMRQKVGETFNAKQARRSMQRVYNLGFFEDVNLKLNPGVEPNAVVLEVDVVEKNTGTFTVGAGYSTKDGFLGMVGIGDTNFHGVGDAINLTYEFSGDDSDAHGYVFSYRKPWLDKKETAALFRIYNRVYEYDDYDTHGDNIEDYMRKYGGGEITFSRPQSEYMTNFITLRHRKDNYVKHEDYLDRSGDNYKKWRDDNFGLSRSIILEHVLDTRDNVFYPMSGNRYSLQFDFTGIGGDFNYRKATFDGSHYIKAGHAQVYALRLMYGHGFGGNIPESGQYRLGGQTSIRGYRDDQFRGNSAGQVTLEYRFPIVTKVTAAIFTDYGGAWNSGWSPKDLYASFGFGLGVQTPVGPIRIDVGHGSQGNRVHFNVGTSF